MKVSNEYIMAIKMIPGVGNVYANEILDCLYKSDDDSYEGIYECISSYASNKKKIKMPESFFFKRSIDQAKEILKKQEALDIIALNRDSAYYPKNFNVLGKAKPVLVFTKGDLLLLNEHKYVALIGTRTPSPHGQKVAERLGTLFAERDLVVVSGLALGCDTYGHKGCIAVKGKTVAILPSPIDDIMPKNNISLANEIVEKGGLLLSEYPIGTKVINAFYVERDKLQAALADGVAVVETTAEGGTMHAVKAAHSFEKPIACYMNDKVYNKDDYVSGNWIMLDNLGAMKLSSQGEIDEFCCRVRNKEEFQKSGQLMFDLV